MHKKRFTILLFCLPFSCLLPTLSHADTTDRLAAKADKLIGTLVEPIVDYLIKEAPGLVRVAKKCIAVAEKNAPMLEKELPRLEQKIFDNTPQMVDAVGKMLPDLIERTPSLVKKGLKVADRELDKALEKEGEDPTAPAREVPLPIDPAKQKKFKIPR